MARDNSDGAAEAAVIDRNPNPGVTGGSPGPRVGYVVKRYPRFSETFIVNEILAHEAAGLRVDLFALGASDDTHFQESISRVRAPLTYLKGDGLRAVDFWEQISTLPDEAIALLSAARGEPARDVCQAAVLARAVRSRGIELLHAHFGTSAANVARIAARLAGVPFTFTAHAKDIFHESVRSDDLARKLREAEAVVTVSDFNRRHLTEAYGPDATGVPRVYNGLNLEQFPFRNETVNADEPPTIVAVGRFVEKKGFSDLVRAAALLKEVRVDFRCQIVGGGEEAARLARLVRELGVGDVLELTGPRPQPDVVAMLRRAAVFAAPCVVGEDGNRDGLPTVLLEAMAIGVPCVSSDVTGIPEVVRHGRTGLIVPQRNPAALAEAIRTLIDGPTQAADLARRARELIEAEFDARRTSAALRRVFASAVESHAHRKGGG